MESHDDLTILVWPGYPNLPLMGHIWSRNADFCSRLGEKPGNSTPNLEILFWHLVCCI